MVPGQQQQSRLHHWRPSAGGCNTSWSMAGTEYSDFGDPPGEGGGAYSASLPTSNDSLTPREIVSMCMDCLQGGDDNAHATDERAGLEICYNFSSDACRTANGGSLESFLQRANNPVFQTMVRCEKWEVENVGPEIMGTNTRGAMQTVLVNVVPSAAAGGGRRDRRFLWTFVRERRPPRQGHFLVHECIAVDNAFALTE